MLCVPRKKREHFFFGGKTGPEPNPWIRSHHFCVAASAVDLRFGEKGAHPTGNADHNIGRMKMQIREHRQRSPLKAAQESFRGKEQIPNVKHGCSTHVCETVVRNCRKEARSSFFWWSQAAVHASDVKTIEVPTGGCSSEEHPASDLIWVLSEDMSDKKARLVLSHKFALCPEGSCPVVAVEMACHFFWSKELLHQLLTRCACRSSVVHKGHAGCP